MTDPRLKSVLKYTVPVLNIVQPNIRVKGTYTFYKQLLKLHLKTERFCSMYSFKTFHENCRYRNNFICIFNT